MFNWIIQKLRKELDIDGIRVSIQDLKSYDWRIERLEKKVIQLEHFVSFAISKLKLEDIFEEYK